MKRWCNIYFNDILMCQQHMKRWCNNVDWSLESVLLNINNDGGDSKRFGLGTHSLNILKRDISYFRNGRVPFKIGAISYLEIVISIEINAGWFMKKEVRYVCGTSVAIFFHESDTASPIYNTHHHTS